MRRASSSIPTNIAEGCGMNSDPLFARFLNIAFGSASELEFQIILASDLGYLDGKTFKQLSKSIEEVKKMLSALLKKVRT
jgi:four helix bundle protein